MKLLRKLGCLVLTGAMVLNFAACSTSDTSWILKDGENQLPAGIYLYNLMQNYSMASYMVEDMSKDVLGQKIEEKDAAQWIQDGAMDTTKRDLAVMKKFGEMGLTLTPDETTYATTQANATWEQSKELCEKNGIAKSSMLLLNELSIMDTKIFNALYGEGGEKAVPTDTLKKAYDETYMKVGVIAISLPTKPTHAEDATEEEKKIADDTYNTTLQAAKMEASNWEIQGQAAASAGKDFNDIINLRNKGLAETPIAYDMSTDNFHLVDTTGTTLPEPVMKGLKEAELGEVVTVETENEIVVGVRKDINENPLDFMSVQQSILFSLKNEEYTALMKADQESDTLATNAASVAKYTAKKVRLQ